MRSVHPAATLAAAASCAVLCRPETEHSNSTMINVAHCAERDNTDIGRWRDEKINRRHVILTRCERAEQASQDSPVAIAPRQRLDSNLRLGWGSVQVRCPGKAQRTWMR